MSPNKTIHIFFSAFIFFSIASCDTAYFTPEQNEIFTSGQFIVNNTVKIDKVLTQKDGWVALYAGATTPQNISPSRLLAKAYVPSGIKRDIILKINDPSVILEHDLTDFTVVLHKDSGEKGTFEFSGSDSPDQPTTGHKETVYQTFTALYIDSEAESYIQVEDQEIEGKTVVVDKVYASEPSLIVLHPDQGYLPQAPIIYGIAKLEEGISEQVEIKLTEEAAPMNCGDILWTMLHVRNASDHQSFEIDLPIVTEPFVVQCN